MTDVSDLPLVKKRIGTKYHIEETPDKSHRASASFVCRFLFLFLVCVIKDVGRAILIQDRDGFYLRPNIY